MTPTEPIWSPERGEIVVTVDGRGRILDIIRWQGETTYKVQELRFGGRQSQGWTVYRRDQIRKETLLEFLFRPTGFGRWSWPEAGIILFAYAILTAYGIASWGDHGWTVVVFACLVLVVIIIEQSLGYGRKR